MTENSASIGINQNPEKRAGLFSKIKKIFEARYTVDGRMLQEQAKLEKIQGVLFPEQQKTLHEKLQKSVKRTVVTDIIVGSTIVVGGMLLVKNRQKLGGALRSLAGKEVVELSPDQWAEKIKGEAKHIGLIGSLKDQEYHAGDWTFRGKYQGNLNLTMDNALGTAIEERIKGAFPNGVPEGAKVIDIISSITDRWELPDKGANKLFLQPKLKRHIDPKNNLTGIAYASIVDPKYFEGYEFPEHGVDPRGSPLIVQMLIPKKLAQPFEKAIEKKPNIIDETVRSLLHGLFADFDLVKTDTLHVYQGGLQELLSRLTRKPRAKILHFSPPVGTA